MTNEASLLDKYASEVFAGLVAPALDGVQVSTAPAEESLAKEDVIFRMNTELKRALEKPASERHWVMVIDLRRCIGCHACTVACIAENKLPPGVVYRPVMIEEIGVYPNVTMKFLPKPCMQCDNPPCTPVCPVNACFNRIAELESVLSRFQPNSQVSILNRSGFIKNAHPAFLSLIEQSRQLSEMTNGAFDITVKPLLDLYQASKSSLPTAQQVEEARELVNYQNIAMSDKEIAFKQADMSITLDGIAKGFIVDEGIAAFKEFGFENVMVEAGGDLMGLGNNGLNSPWKIGLQSPRAEMDNLSHTFDIQNQAIATSGDYMQAFTSDFLYHHIIDPRSGYSPRELASVSVIAPNTTLADGLATAAMVLGKSAMTMLKRVPNCQIYAITKDLQIIQS